MLRRFVGASAAARSPPAPRSPSSSARALARLGRLGDLRRASACSCCVWAWGSFTPNSPLFGRVVTGRGTNDRVLALTFDDGPSPGVDAAACSTRCATAARARRSSCSAGTSRRTPSSSRGSARRATRSPRTATTTRCSTFAVARPTSSAQLERTERSLADALGRQPRPRLFRAPHGFRNPFVARVTGAPRLRGRRLDEGRLGHREARRRGDRAAHDRRLPAGRHPAAARRRRQRRRRRPQPDRRGRAGDRRARARRRLRARDRLGAGDAGRRRGARRPGASSPGSCSSASCVELALRSVDIEHGQRRSTSPGGGSIAALGLNLASILLKAVVWKAALDTIPDHPRFQYVHVVPALFIGFLLNTLLPARLGEIGRVAVLRRRLKLVGTDVPNATLAGSLVAEQIVLAIALVAIMLLQLPFVNVPARFENMILAFGGVVIVVLLAVIGLEAFSRKSRRAVRPDYAFTRGQQALAMLHPIARGMQQGQTVLRRPRTARLGAGRRASPRGRRRSAASTRRSRPPTSTRRSARPASSSSSRRSCSCSRSGPATSASSRPPSPRCSCRPTRSTSRTRSRSPSACR